MIDIIEPRVMKSLARDKQAILQMPAQVFWTPRKSTFGWTEAQVDATLYRARGYLKSVLNIELRPKKIGTKPPLNMLFNNDPTQAKVNVFLHRFNARETGTLCIYFIDFIQGPTLGLTARGKNVVLLNGQLLLRRQPSGFSAFSTGSDAGMTLVHEIGHSLNMKDIKITKAMEKTMRGEEGFLMAGKFKYVRLRLSSYNENASYSSEDRYYLARLYGLIHKRLKRSHTSLL